jgi:hypothetical protein
LVVIDMQRFILFVNGTLMRGQELNGNLAVTGELYLVPTQVWTRVEAGEPPGLYRGPVELDDGRVVHGILYPRELAEGRHGDIFEFGDWRAYMAASRAANG